MEWDSVEEMRKEVNETVQKGLRFCYGSCCHDLQTKEQYRQDALLQKLDEYRHQAIDANNEEQANSAFVSVLIVTGLLNHLQLWLLVKADRMDEAWNQLVEAQVNLRCALRFVKGELLQHWYLELLALEKMLFPPQQFVSSSHYFEQSTCTICNELYGECEHLIGKLYMGRICQQSIAEISRVDHVALVDDPEDKGCRWTKRKRDGYMYCTLTYRQMEEAGDDRGDIEFCIIRTR